MRCVRNSTIRVVINDDAAEFVASAARQRDVSVYVIIRKALSAYRYLLRIFDSEGQVVIQRADGALEKLVGL